MVEELEAVVTARLRRVGQRITAARRALVEALATAGRPLTASELLDSSGRLPQSTAYRNLSILEQAGVINRVVGSDEYARFELSEALTGHHHHHLVCRSCGTVEDFEPPPRLERALADKVREVVGESGFVVDSHRLDLLGTCAQCVSTAVSR